MEIVIDKENYESFANALIDINKTHKKVTKKIKTLMGKSKLRPKQENELSLLLEKSDELSNMFYVIAGGAIENGFGDNLINDKRLPHNEENDEELERQKAELRETMVKEMDGLLEARPVEVTETASEIVQDIIDTYNDLESKKDINE